MNVFSSNTIECQDNFLNFFINLTFKSNICDSHIYNDRDKTFKRNSNNLSINSSSSLYNREGILCGNCSTNYSVVFGFTECRQCSD